MDAAIKVENLKKSYGNITVLNDVNISVKRGEVFGLLGANGAGKSTAIECILGTRKPDKGRVRILGMDPAEDRKKLFENVGVQFQESSCQDNILVSELRSEERRVGKECTG